MRDELSELEDELRDLEGAERDLDFRQRITWWDCSELPLIRSRIEEVRRLVKERNEEILKEDKNAAFLMCWEKYRKANWLTQGFPVWEKKYRNRFDILWEKNKLRNVADLDLFLYRDN